MTPWKGKEINHRVNDDICKLIIVDLNMQSIQWEVQYNEKYKLKQKPQSIF